MKAKQTAGQSRKSHKSRKTGATTPPASSPSSTALATQPLPSLPISVSEAVKLVAEKVGPKDEETRDTGIIAPEPKKQWWYRPADSKARKIAERIAVLDAAGHRDEAIAKKLHTTAPSVRQYRYIAKKNGWLDEDGEPVDVELEMAMDVDRKVVRNISASLDGQMTNWQTHEMTIAAAKGRGHFKSHEVIKGDSAVSMPVVAIQVVMPPVGAGDQRPEIREDQMGGLPAYEEGEVDDVGATAASAEHSASGPEEAVGSES